MLEKSKINLYLRNLYLYLRKIKIVSFKKLAKLGETRSTIQLLQLNSIITVIKIAIEFDSKPKW